MEPDVLSRLRRGAIAAILLVVTAFPGHSDRSTASPSFWDEAPAEQLVQSLVEAMTDQELLGQVLMLGYRGMEPSPEFLRWIGQRGLGGVKIFSRNVSSLRELAASIARMQAAARQSRLGIPLLVSTDQEGGWVRHIKGRTSETPGNIALGATALPRDAFLTGHYIGEELRSLGINMNFAPTTDVYSNPRASVIGPRSFSSDPKATAMLALAYFKGLASTGVISTAKHYPGHGSADKDSHGALPVIDIPFTTMWERELLPYRVLVKEGLPAIMSGHLAFPQVLGDRTPASLSPLLIRDVLRRRIGFDGVLVTDDMEMNGVLSGGLTTPEAGLKAIQAGNDVILISHTPRVQEESWEYLRRRLAADPELRELLQESAARILRLKIRVFKRDRFPLEAEAAAAIPAPGAAKFFAESAARSVTLIRGARLPYRPGKGERVLLLGQFQDFLDQGRRRFPQADVRLFPYSPFYHARPEDATTLPALAARYDTVIFCLANYNSLDVLEAMRDLADRIIVISTLSPVYLRDVSWVGTSLAVYGTFAESFRAGFAALAGDFPAEGILPVDFLGQ